MRRGVCVHGSHHTKQQRNEVRGRAAAGALGRRHEPGRRRQGSEDSEREKRLCEHGRDGRPDDRRRRVEATERAAPVDAGRRVADEAVHLDAVAGDQLIEAAVEDGDDDLALGAGRRSGGARREALLAAADAAHAELGRVLQLTAGPRAQLQQLQPNRRTACVPS